MKLTATQLRRIIREEVSKTQLRRIIREEVSGPREGQTITVRGSTRATTSKLAVTSQFTVLNPSSSPSDFMSVEDPSGLVWAAQIRGKSLFITSDPLNDMPDEGWYGTGYDKKSPFGAEDDEHSSEYQEFTFPIISIK